MTLEQLGWTALWRERFARFASSCEPARVIAAYRGEYHVCAETGELRAEVSGKLWFDSEAPQLPVTGDWVALRRGTPLIHAVLPRSTSLSRKQAGTVTEEQVLAANLDLMMVVTGLDGDYNVRRIERYLVTARRTGARVLLVLNKSDLCDDVYSRLVEVEAVANGVPIAAVSALEASGLAQLEAHLRPGETAALIGSSGAGKSTLVNALAGRDLRPTKAVREHDSRGRHTTTARELIVMPQGWLLIDMPGIRELQPWADAGAVDEAFSDVAEQASGCRFRDCRHVDEPGCAVRAAIETGAIDPARLASYHKLQRELEHLETRQDARLSSNQKRRWKAIHKAMRHYKKPGAM